MRTCDHGEVDVLRRGQPGNLEHSRRIGREGNGDNRPLKPVDRDLRLGRRLPLKLPWDLRVHLTGADKVQMPRQAKPVRVKADAYIGERYGQERRRLNLQRVREI